MFVGVGRVGHFFNQLPDGSGDFVSEKVDGTLKDFLPAFVVQLPESFVVTPFAEKLNADAEFVGHVDKDFTL